MRFYSLTLTDNSGKQVRQWTSHPNGVNAAPDPGALNIEFDVMVSTFGTPIDPGGSIVTLEGVALADLYQPQQFVGLNFVLQGGMGIGLPLANPAQAGVLMSGIVAQAFGNWVEDEMTLDFVVTGTTKVYSLEGPGNFTPNIPANTEIKHGIAQVLTQNYPGVKQIFNLQSGLVFSNVEAHVCSTLRQFSGYIQGLTKGFGGKATYPGVSIASQGGQFLIFDGTTNTTSVQIAFNDLVGQPTWIDANTMQIQTVMRGDIQISNNATLPTGLQDAPGIATTIPLITQSKYSSTFQGAFNVFQIRHVGNFRSPSGLDWVSIYNCSLITNG